GGAAWPLWPWMGGGGGARAIDAQNTEITAVIQRMDGLVAGGLGPPQNHRNRHSMQISKPKNVAPSRSAATTIIVPRTSLATSGWRAMLSSAAAPIFPNPMPAPMMASATPKPAAPYLPSRK